MYVLLSCGLIGITINIITSPPHLMHLLLLFVGCTMWPYVGDCVLPAAAALNGPIEYCIPFRPFPHAFLFFKYKSSIHTPTTYTNHHNPNGHPHPILYNFTENHLKKSHRFFDGFCDRGPSPPFAPISRGSCSCVCWWCWCLASDVLVLFPVVDLVLVVVV